MEWWQPFLFLLGVGACLFLNFLTFGDGDELFPRKTKQNKSKVTDSHRRHNFILKDKPFPNSRPPNGESANPYKPTREVTNPLERDLSPALEDRFVYWETEEGLQRFDVQSEWECYDEDLEMLEPHSKLSPVFVDFPSYDPTKLEYPEYKKWKDFCVQINHFVPYRIFKEFDD
ncbi:hypothetical protein [Pseudodesulfovibrio sediminis]|uniref:Uncharacterized protein n=1 Tax=Pseudodesulfovibrio sediminis TaxID=2810563 RepID=A0ABN6EMN5_9BACT|nr:hypothetical protein [Pseudodesulfovibrio sediminis]BCS87353.1 hypothetical protein PSDVSF_05950 [Pseudodesulfovibrio sediminis]